MDIHLLQLPFDSGHFQWRMGKGPGAFLEQGLEARLKAKGHRVESHPIGSSDPHPAEIATTFGLYRQLAGQVWESRAAGALPVVLSGNCGAGIGSTAGLQSEPVGILWFDAHGDFNTPETSSSGYLDGMGLAVAAGCCWRRLAAQIPHFQPVPSSQIIHLGARDLETEEEQAMRAAGVQIIPARDLNGQNLATALLPALDRLRETVQTVYVHLDLDVLDPTSYPANHFVSPPTGLNPQTVKQIIEMVKARLKIGALGIASYDPSFDPDQKTLHAGIEMIEIAAD